MSVPGVDSVALNWDVELELDFALHVNGLESSTNSPFPTFVSFLATHCPGNHTLAAPILLCLLPSHLFLPFFARRHALIDGQRDRLQLDLLPRLHGT